MNLGVNEKIIFFKKKRMINKNVNDKIIFFLRKKKERLIKQRNHILK